MRAGLRTVASVTAAIRAGKAPGVPGDIIIIGPIVAARMEAQGWQVEQPA
jgi:hypothetical protein